MLDATTLISGNEIALPGFAAVDENMEFRIEYNEPVIAEGGGGIIRRGHALDWKHGAKLIKQGYTQCAVKQVKDTILSVFIQEVALMYYLRDND